MRDKSISLIARSRCEMNGVDGEPPAVKYQATLLVTILRPIDTGRQRRTSKRTDGRTGKSKTTPYNQCVHYATLNNSTCNVRSTPTACLQDHPACVYRVIRPRKATDLHPIHSATLSGHAAILKKEPTVAARALSRILSLSHTLSFRSSVRRLRLKHILP